MKVFLARIFLAILIVALLGWTFGHVAALSFMKVVRDQMETNAPSFVPFYETPNPTKDA